MTIAVCTACGTQKFGAFSPCKDCGFTPQSNEERAKSVLLSDHHYTHAQLDELGSAIKMGQTIVYDPVSVVQYAQAFGTLNVDRGCGKKV